MEMQEGTAAFGGMLAAQNKVVDAQGNIVTGAERYRFILGESKKLYEDTRRVAEESAGTQEEAEGVMRQILVHGQGQKSTAEERLQLAKNLLDISIAEGQHGDKAIVNVRQILEAEMKKGNLFLTSLGVTLEQTREWKKQGVLIQKIGELAAEAGKGIASVGDRLEVVSTTAGNLIEKMRGTIGEDLFKGLMDVLIGFNQEMRKIAEKGGLAQVLGLSQAELREIGAELARTLVAVTKLVVQFTILAAKAIELFNIEQVFMAIGTAIKLVIASMIALKLWTIAVGIATVGVEASIIAVKTASTAFGIAAYAAFGGLLPVLAAVSAAALALRVAYDLWSGDSATTLGQVTGELPPPPVKRPAKEAETGSKVVPNDKAIEADEKAMRAAAKAAREYADSLEKLRSLER
ncbi:MAG: hypothetical protein Q8R07_01405, partial [Candidatus Uhrbacteria bacterium]|nr:hypothetical protein [Candidatus Uhrbacteria bacterium]